MMDKIKGLAILAVALLVMTAIGAAVLYTEVEDLRNEKERLAVREEVYRSLMSLESDVQDVLISANDNLVNAAAKLSDTGLNGTDARAIMNEALANMTYGVDMVTIDTHGVIVACEPVEYQGIEGTNISDQAQVIRMLSSHMPVMSEVFMMTEGFAASDMEVPIFTEDGTFNGSLSITLDIESIIRDKVEALNLTSGFQITCLQDDGLEVYDTDEDQIGRNLFTDPIYENYTETLAFMHEMLGSSNGYGTYEYYESVDSGNLVSKEVYWSSFGMHGISWTLMFIHVL
jgi:branched-chain amino acid transport system substrate-binding protein